MGCVREVKTHAGHAFSGFQLTYETLNNLQQFNISPTAKLVLLYLTSCYNSSKADVFPKQKTIALKLGISERSVVRAIQELVKAGVILVECNVSNKYIFVARRGTQRGHDEKIFKSEKLSDNEDKISQTDDKLSGPCIQPEKEQVKQPQKSGFNSLDFEGFKILKDYAIKHGAKNVNAYINALKKNGSCKEILDNYRAAKRSSEYMLGLTQQVIENNKIARETAQPPTQNWKDLKKILIERASG